MTSHKKVQIVESQHSAKEIAEQQRWYDEHIKTFEHIWATWPYVIGAPISFLRLSMVAEQRTRNRRYFSSGKFRFEETHCLFQYTLKGSGCFRNATGEHEVGPGIGFLCAIDDPETAYYYQEGSGEWRFLSVCLEGEAARVMVRELVSRHGPIFKVPLDAPIWHQLQNFKSGQYSVPQVSLLTAVELASMFLVALSQSVAQAEEEPADVLMKKAMQRLSSPMPLPEIGDLAASLHVSREHFSRVFRRRMGVCPQHWMNQERINRACRLLRATDLSNKQLAHQLGYKETSSFVRAFRRTMNATPQQFRQTAQDTPAPETTSETS